LTETARIQVQASNVARALARYRADPPVEWAEPITSPGQSTHRIIFWVALIYSLTMNIQAAQQPSESRDGARARHVVALHWLALAAAVVAGVSIIIKPAFPANVPSYAGSEFVAQVGAVAAAVETWRVTHALPISSNEIHADVEYPYVLFGNMAFYLAAAGVSSVLGFPAYVGAAITLAAGFALATYSMFLLATRAGLNPYLSVALGFLYATGPYLCVNLFVRNAFPEYLTWQMVPMLLLVVSWALQPRAGPMAVLAGVLALAAPFYLHKLVAPHIALVLAILAFNAAPWRATTLFRLAVVGSIAVLFSVPAWYPGLRGLGEEAVRGLGGDVAPGIFHTSLTNLFWPYALNSLPSGPAFDFYEGRFALQVGLVSLAGIVIAAGMVLSQPQLAWARRVPLPLGLYVINVLLIMGWFELWEVAPAPLRYVQFAYRLIGLVHFLGFVLFVQALGSPKHLLRRARLLPQWLAAVLFVVLALLGARTYWHTPPSIPMGSADIRPGDLGAADPCTFCRPTPQSSLATRGAISPDRALVVPPMPIPVPVEAGPRTVILGGKVRPMVFEQSSGDLIVRIYGFVKLAPEATLYQLTSVIVGNAATQDPVAPVASLYGATRRGKATDGIGAAFVNLPNISWAVRPLAEVSVASPSPFRVQASLDESIEAIAIECSRGVSPKQTKPASAEIRTLCVDVDFLAPPNQDGEFVVPRETPRSSWTRAALGQVTIDARKLSTGPYLLPTFDYGFVRVVDAAGSPVPTSHFNRRPMIWHAGSLTSYTVSYDFQPERLALTTGVILFLLSALVMRLWRLRAS
jgi:hypothetical protein